MPTEMTAADPGRFGLTSFADVLPARQPIPGEDPGSFAAFHDGMMQSLAPVTAYECVKAKQLIDIEWQLSQHIRMRDDTIRDQITKEIEEAAFAKLRHDHDTRLSEIFVDYVDRGGDESKWVPPSKFNIGAAKKEAKQLAEDAVSADPEVQSNAYKKIVRLGVKPNELLEIAYRNREAPAVFHQSQIKELESRASRAKRDYDLLQRSRPIEAKVIGG